MQSSVHSNVRRLRIAKGISLTHVANQLGLTRQGYSLKEKGISPIDADELTHISEIVGEVPGVFFDDKLTSTVIDGIRRRAKRGKGDAKAKNRPTSA